MFIAMSNAASDAFARKGLTILGAPPIVAAMAILLVLLHAAFEFADPVGKLAVTVDFALWPQRFWAPAGSNEVYPDHVSGLLTLLSSGLLHANWLHVAVNALMVLAFGAPVARALGNDGVGAGAWMLLFVVSVIGGSAAYLAIVPADAPYLIGASGGVSGLVAASFLFDEYGAKRMPWAPGFLMLTAGFAVMNLLLVWLGPALVGGIISWEAHAGGYVAGTLVMALLPARGVRLAGS